MSNFIDLMRALCDEMGVSVTSASPVDVTIWFKDREILAFAHVHNNEIVIVPDQTVKPSIYRERINLHDPELTEKFQECLRKCMKKKRPWENGDIKSSAVRIRIKNE